MLTQTLLRERLHYDPETGVFTRRVADGKSRWKAGQVAGSASKHLGYVEIGVLGKSFWAHRLVWLHVHGCWPAAGMHIDHINGVKSDNRLANLRLVTEAVNRRNRVKPQKHGTSGYLGVYWHKVNRTWIAQITYAGTVNYIGSFETAKAASDAYFAAKAQHHGVEVYQQRLGEIS